MTTLTMTRLTAADETDAHPSSTVEVRTDKGQAATVRVFRDGSTKHVDGPAYVLASAGKVFGARNITRALLEAAREGSATVTP